MKAAVVRAPQAPVEIVELTRPVRGPGGILVKMQTCGICHSDLFIAGAPVLPRAPLVLCREGLGIVKELGPEVHNLKVGDRVGISFLHRACGTYR